MADKRAERIVRLMKECNAGNYDAGYFSGVGSCCKFLKSKGFEALSDEMGESAIDYFEKFLADRPIQSLVAE